MTEKDKKTEGTPPATPETYTKEQVESMVSTAVAKATSEATAELNKQIKEMKEAQMTEQELAKARQAEQEAATQQHIASLERETRVNFAQSLLAQHGLPSDVNFAEIYAGFDKETIKMQIEAQAKLVVDATEQAKLEFAKAHAPQGSTPPTGAAGKAAFTSQRAILEQQGLV